VDEGALVGEDGAPEDKGSLLGAADGALQGVDEGTLVRGDEGSLLGAAEEAPEDEG
jgi:hypothetical protein